MCQYELWVYQKCSSTTTSPSPSPPPSPYINYTTTITTPHSTYFRVAKCPNSPQCTPPPPPTTPDFKSTPELPVQLRNRYCNICFEALASTINGVGETCWPLAISTDYYHGSEFWIDERLCRGVGVVDLEGFSGMDSKVDEGRVMKKRGRLQGGEEAADGGGGGGRGGGMEGARARQGRLKYLARNWRGWTEWGDMGV